MSELIALGASHKTAAVAVRERIAMTETGAERFMRELVAEPTISEAVVLSTCNRTELYLVVGDPVEAESIVLGHLARRAGVRPTELVEGIYSLRNCDAARHLYRVASGLESMVIGEAEVQGQVKRAYEAALSAKATGPLTNKLFRAALATGKRVRTETAISAGRASVASVASHAALYTCFTFPRSAVSVLRRMGRTTRSFSRRCTPSAIRRSRSSGLGSTWKWYASRSLALTNPAPSTSPRSRFIPLLAAQRSTASNSAFATAGSSTDSKNPQKAVASLWNSL